MNKLKMIFVLLLLFVIGCHFNPVSESFAFRKPTLREKKMFESYEKINDSTLTSEEREMWMKQFLLDVNRVIEEINNKNGE